MRLLGERTVLVDNATTISAWVRTELGNWFETLGDKEIADAGENCCVVTLDDCEFVGRLATTQDQ
jgi:hypothetical protein